VIVPRIFASQPAAGGVAPVTDGAAGSRAGVQAQGNANADSTGLNPTFGTNKPPTQTWQPAAPLNPSRNQPTSGSSAPRQQDSPTGAKANSEDD
jgi:hypothetical protein